MYQNTGAVFYGLTGNELISIDPSNGQVVSQNVPAPS